MTAGLNATLVAGNPFSLTVTASSLGDVTDPVAEVTSNGNAISQFAPTITTDGDTWVLRWSADQTAKMGAYGPLPWSLQATVNGSGPYALIGGSLRFLPPTTPGPSGPTSADLTVDVGGVTVDLSVTAQRG